MLPATASAHAGYVTPSRLAGAWSASPAVIAGGLLTAILFGQAWIRLRRRGRPDQASPARIALFAAALALGTLPLVSPLDPAGDRYLLSGHMLQHVLIGDAAPALALAAVRGPLLFFLLPPLVLRPLARARPVRVALGALVRPRVALGIWLATFAAWHVPAAYDYTLTHRTVHDLEHLSFIVAGLLVWTQLVDPARRRHLGVPQRLVFAVALFAAGQALSYTLIFSMTPLYPAYAAQGTRLFGLSPLTDQQLAGVVMMVEQLLTLGTCAALQLSAYRRPPVPTFGVGSERAA